MSECRSSRALIKWKKRRRECVRLSYDDHILIREGFLFFVRPSWTLYTWLNGSRGAEASYFFTPQTLARAMRELMILSGETSKGCSPFFPPCASALTSELYVLFGTQRESNRCQLAIRADSATSGSHSFSENPRQNDKVASVAFADSFVHI